MFKKICSVFTIAFIACTLTFTGCDKKDKISSLNNQKVENIKLSKEDKEDFINLELYFQQAKDNNKAEVAKEPRIINKKELFAEIIMEELIKGPSTESKLGPILPKETKVLNVSIKEGIAYVNLSGDAKSAMNKSKELACLKSIVYSLTKLEYINKVKILVDSKDVDTLGGNYDISKPLGKEELEMLK